MIFNLQADIADFVVNLWEAGFRPLTGIMIFNTEWHGDDYYTTTLVVSVPLRGL